MMHWRRLGFQEEDEGERVSKGEREQQPATGEKPLFLLLSMTGRESGPAACACSAYGGVSPAATHVRGKRRRTNDDAKCRFCPWRACENTGTATA
jgi:hypothetical protein